MATDAERLLIRLEVTQAKFEKQLAKANGTVNRRARSMERRFDKMNRTIGSGASRLGGRLVAAFASVAALRGAQALVDASTRINNALKVAGLSGAELTNVYDKLFESALRNGAPLENLVSLYSRAALAQKDLGVTTQELVKFTDNVAIALRVAGTSAGASSGALLQLAQAMGGGVVRAEEFNSLLEGALPIAQAAAAGLDEAGGSVSKLRQLVIDGKVSSEAFFRAFEAGAPTLQEKVADSELTIAQSMTNIQTALIGAASRFDDVVNASGNFASAIDGIANVINRFDIAPILSQLDALGDAFGDFGNNPVFQKLSNMLGVDTTIKYKIVAGQGLVRDDGLSEEAIRQSVTNRKTGRLPATAKKAVKTVSLDDFALPDDDKDGKKERLDSLQREIRAIEERTAAIQVGIAAQSSLNPLIDDYGFAVERAAAVQELLAAAQRAGVAVTPQLRAQIEALAEGYAASVVQAEKLAESQDRVRQSVADMAGFGRDAMGGFINDMRNGVTAAESLANALDKVIDRLLDSALDGLFGGGSTKGNGFLGDLLGSVFGGGLSGGGDPWAGLRYAKGGVVRQGRDVPLKRFAGGGVSNRAAIFGEAGPEAAVPLPDGRRIPVDLNPGAMRRGGSETIHIKLQADSSLVAEIADQRIQTASGQIVQVSVQKARELGAADFAGNQIRTRTRRETR